jgi:hypothetical protein
MPEPKSLHRQSSYFDANQLDGILRCEQHKIGAQWGTETMAESALRAALRCLNYGYSFPRYGDASRKNVFWFVTVSVTFV